MGAEIWIALAVGALAALGTALLGRNATVSGPRKWGTRISSVVDTAPVEIDARLPALPLEERETGFYGKWQEARVRDCRVAFLSIDKGVQIIVGDFDADLEQLSDVYLGQVGDTRPLPEALSPQRLVVALGTEGGELDDRFYLNATGGAYEPLRRPGVRRALLELSDSIVDVSLLESGGVELWTDASATRDSVASDMEVAVALQRALRS